jgi:transcriptional repressor NrdR
MAAITSLVADVENTLRQEGSLEVRSERVGTMVMERLYPLDQVAYVRFASVYQRFDDVRLFAHLLQTMSRQPVNGTGRTGKKGRKSDKQSQLSLSVPEEVES